MAIGAVRVMAAGKAGLESLPYFVDEFLAQGVEQLAPWAIDHSDEDLDRLRQATAAKVRGNWGSSRKIYELGNTPPGSSMQTDSTSTKRFLTQINPLATDMAELEDAPARLGAWCRGQIRQYCRDTDRMWENFKREKGLTSSYQLAVVIPYCPEGPTSGTVGMYLGAALQRYFAGQNKSDQLVVWGIELCPPVYHGSNEAEMDRTAVNNAFRGYVARQEVLGGVPLSEDPEDDERVQCFDINIVFDGGTVHTGDVEKAWAALDRAAAQATACLLNGAGGGDRAESIVQLKQGKRWNAYLAHVISERSYSDACRYLRYRVALPWFREPATWDRASLPQQKETLLRLLTQHRIRQLLDSEENTVVANHVQTLVDKADQLNGISLASSLIGMLNGKNKSNQDLAQSLLRAAKSDDEDAYRRAKEATEEIDSIKAKNDHFCINIELPENQRIEAAEIARDNGIQGPVAEVIGDAGVAIVRQRLAELCNEVLKRPDLVSLEVNSGAVFDEIMSISIGDWSRNTSNDAFRPSRELLRDFVAADRRNIPGAFSEMTFDLSKVISPDELADGRSGESNQAAADDDSQSTVPRPRQPSAMKWRLSDIDYDVPIEYSILVLGRVREGDGFRDVSTYGDLEKNYRDLTASLSRWRELARYYGVMPPPELLESDGDQPSSGSRVTVQATAVTVVRENV